MDVERIPHGFRVIMSHDEEVILAWAERKFGPNEFLLMVNHWILQRKRDRDQIDGKDLRAAFEQLPEELQAKIKEKIDELRFED